MALNKAATTVVNDGGSSSSAVKTVVSKAAEYKDDLTTAAKKQSKSTSAPSSTAQGLSQAITASKQTQTASAADSAVAALVEPETVIEQYEDDYADDYETPLSEPAQKESPLFTPLQSRSSAVQIAHTSSTGNFADAAANFKNKMTAAAQPASGIYDNEQRKADHTAQMQEKLALDAAYNNEQRKADHAANMETAFAQRTTDADTQIANYIGLDRTGGYLTDEETRRLGETLRRVSEGVQNAEDYETADRYFEELESRAHLRGDDVLSDAYRNARDKLQIARRTAEEQAFSDWMRNTSYAPDLETLFAQNPWAQTDDQKMALIRQYYPEYAADLERSAMAGLPSVYDSYAVAERLRSMDEQPFTNSAVAKGVQMATDFGLNSFVNPAAQYSALVDNLTGGQVFANDPKRERFVQDSSLLATAARQGAENGMSETGKKVYEIGLNVLENSARRVLYGGASVAVGALNAGTSAANQAYYNGATTGQALAVGAVNGLAEYLTENVEFKKLEKIRNASTGSAIADIFKNAAVAFPSEFTEEGLSEAASIFADLAFMGDKSDIYKEITERLPEDPTKAQEVIGLLCVAVPQVLESGLIGGIAGAIQGGQATVESILNYGVLPGVQNTRYTVGNANNPIDLLNTGASEQTSPEIEAMVQAAQQNVQAQQTAPVEQSAVNAMVHPQEINSAPVNADSQPQIFSSDSQEVQTPYAQDTTKIPAQDSTQNAQNESSVNALVNPESEIIRLVSEARDVLESDPDRARELIQEAKDISDSMNTTKNAQNESAETPVNPNGETQKSAQDNSTTQYQVGADQNGEPIFEDIPLSPLPGQVERANRAERANWDTRAKRAAENRAEHLDEVIAEQRRQDESEAQLRSFKDSLTEADTAASWVTDSPDARPQNPDAFKARITDNKSINGTRQVVEAQYQAKRRADMTRNSLHLDATGRAAFDLMIKNPNDQRMRQACYERYGQTFLDAVDLTLQYNRFKTIKDANSRRIASFKHQKAAEMVAGLNFKPNNIAKNLNRMIQNADEAMRSFFGNSPETERFIRETIGMVDANENLRNQDLAQTKAEFERMHLTAAESAAETLISDHGLTADGSTIFTEADLRSIADAHLTKSQSKQLGDIARKMQKATRALARTIDRAGYDPDTVFSVDPEQIPNLPANLQTALNKYYAILEDGHAKITAITDNQSVLTMMDLASAGWMNTEALDTLYNLSPDKVLKAKEKFDKYYADTYQLVSDTYLMNGYDNVGYLEGYRPHFRNNTENKSFTSLLDEMRTSELPLEIAGQTEDRRPGRRFAPNLQLSRTGKKSYIDSLVGLNRYANSASHVIYHTGDISMLRAVVEQVRSEFSEASQKELFDSILNADPYELVDMAIDEETFNRAMNGEPVKVKNVLDEQGESEVKQKALARTKGRQSGGAEAFVNWLTEYTNIIAGKQSNLDRAIEKNIGRRALNVADKVTTIIGGPMIRNNVSSAFSNLAPLFQAGDIGGRAMSKAVYQFATGQTDVLNRIDFTANRFADTRIQTDYDRKNSFDLMNVVDTPVVKIVALAYYNQNIQDGYSQSEAIALANEQLNNTVGGRSLGQNPLIFNSRSARPLTQFKREAVRDLWLRPKGFVDTIMSNPNLSEGQKKARAVEAVTRYTVNSALFGVLSTGTVGYVVGFSPIHTILEMLKGGGYLKDDEDDEKLLERVKEVWDDVEARFSGTEAERTVMESLLYLLGYDPGDGTTNEKGKAFESTKEKTLALLAPWLEEFPLFGSRFNQGPAPVVSGFTKLGTSVFNTIDYLKSDNLTPEEKARLTAEDLGKSVLKTLVPGGNQMQKTLFGAADLLQGYKSLYTKANDYADESYGPAYALDKDPISVIRTLLFGSSVNPAVDKYYNSGYWPLEDEEKEQFNALIESGVSPEEAFAQIRGEEDLENATRQEKESLGITQDNVEDAGPLLEAVRGGMMDADLARSAIEATADNTGVQGEDGKTISGSIKAQDIQDYIDLGMNYDEMRTMLEASAYNTDVIDRMMAAEKAGISNQEYVNTFLDPENGISEYRFDELMDGISRDIGITPESYADAVRMEESAQGVKGANGKTINGSKKYAIYEGLKDLGWTDEQIEWYMTQRIESKDGDPMYKDMKIDYKPSGASTTGTKTASAGSTTTRSSGSSSGSSARSSGTASSGVVRYDGKTYSNNELKKRNTASDNYVTNMGYDKAGAEALFDGLYGLKGSDRAQQRMNYLKESGASEAAIAWIWNAPQDEGGFGYTSSYTKYYNGTTSSGSSSSGGSSSGGYSASSGSSGRSASTTARQTASGSYTPSASLQSFMSRWGLTGNPGRSTNNTSGGGFNYSSYASRLGTNQNTARNLYSQISLLAPLSGSNLVSRLRGMGLTDNAIRTLWTMPLSEGGLGRSDLPDLLSV